jgi:hypothetical protein
VADAKFTYADPELIRPASAARMTQEAACLGAEIEWLDCPLRAHVVGTPVIAEADETSLYVASGQNCAIPLNIFVSGHMGSGRVHAGMDSRFIETE